uniref:Stabilin 1 n=1 Tax=Xiphophorus maculatus TaxID=8083 RepID=A0A3B5QNS4_XIPMA
GRCDVPQRLDVYTACTSCAASVTSSCPRGSSKLSTSNCSYLVQIGSRELELPGCHHLCVKNILQPQCCPGHWGPLCLSCPSWSGRICNYNGDCVDGDIGNGTCICKEGFSGFACQECKNPNAFGKKCDEECDCVNGVCNKGPDGDGQCWCQPPYTGRRCDQVSRGCRRCSSYSYCKGEAEDADCDCLPGYRKMKDNRCLAACSQRDCDANAQCSKEASNIRCTCRPGYDGDGKICIPKNPCLVNNGGCPANSTVCVFKGPDKSSCECMLGMSPVGGSAEHGCQLVSACTAVTCDPTATCQMELDGKPRCLCEPGLIGDGHRCYGNLMARLMELDQRGNQRENLTGAVALFGGGCPMVLSHSGPFTAFFPLLKEPLTEEVCRNHLVLGQHLYQDLEGRDFSLYGGGKLRVKANKKFILLSDPSRPFTIVQADLPAANGVIHIIDRETFRIIFCFSVQFADKTIGEILRKDEKFNRFLSLVDNCGSPPPLRGPGPLTLFVPTNEAVDRARDGSILYMLNSAKQKLQELLRHHVFSQAALTVDDLVALPQVRTMANQLVTVSGEVLLGEKGVRLAGSDIMASNGVIHMINGLLYPPSILPILPHRCDVTKSKITLGPCIHCSFLDQTACPEGTVEMVNIHYSHRGADFCFLPAVNSHRLCLQVAQCCSGFYGPDCKPCIGGFQHPCYDKGTCLDGIHGNGSCSCHPGFKGIACHICSDSSKHGENCDEECRCVHGLCDNRPGSGGACRRGSCSDGFSGDYCDWTATPCNADGLLAHCHVHAYCTHSGLNYRCICRDGYEGDGHSCSPINLCLKSSRGGCDANAECVFVAPGNVSCVCAEGWMGDGTVCVEINNCELQERGGCSPNATCNHIGPGQVEISECLVLLRPIGGQGAKCKLEEGGVHTCTCMDGYGGDGKLCYGSLLDELDMNIKFYNFYKLIQSRNSEDLSGNLTVLVPSREAMRTLSTEENSFWTSRHFLPHLLRSESLSFDPRVLLPARSGLPPEPPTLMAFLNSSSSFSLFRRAALIYNLTDRLADEEFTLLLPTDEAVTNHLSGTNSSVLDWDVLQYHVIPKELLLPDHLHDGLLKNTLLGSDHQVQFHLTNTNQTAVNDVPLNGSVVETQYGVILVLPQVLRVRRNRCIFVILLVLVNCSNLGSDGPDSDNLLSPFLLQIRDRFPASMKPNCFYRKRVGQRRKSVPGCTMKCLRISSVSDHACCPGFYGHECFKCPGDDGSPCSNHGQCQDGNHGNGECRCYEGFHGTACEDCEPGRYGVNCTSSECSCDHGKCDDGLAGSGRCLCYKGWKGTTCSAEIRDDACGGVCDENANCVTGPQGSAAACVCVAGYEGNGTFCQELDVCSRSNGGCSEFAECTKVSAGERTCACSKGYTGDGVVCLEIDGCLVNNGGCHKAAECIRTGPNTTACQCQTGFQGSGRFCYPVNPCRTDNGGCSKYARCEYLGLGQRNCTCQRGHIGDGFTCRGTTRILSAGLVTSVLSPQLSDIGLYGDGPFTVFLPVKETNNNSKIIEWKRAGRLPDLTRYHVVSCEILTLSDLKTATRAVSLSGYTLEFSLKEGSVWINNQSVIVKSDYTTSNGVIHYIDRMLTPYRLEDQLTAAAFYGYGRFYKLVEDAGLLPVLQLTIHQPFTVFWPSDQALGALPAARQRWLSNPDHQDQLAATVKAHIVRDSKVKSADSRSYRTMHGSTIKFSCDKSLVGAVIINENAARLVQRHLSFKEGVGFGIDQLLEPPGLGAFCDSMQNKTTYGRCGSCLYPPPCSISHVDTVRTNFSAHASLYHSRLIYDLDDGYSRGCKRVCLFPSWVQKCCKNHYGRDCQVCAGGVENPCSGHGDCNDGISGSGTCKCQPGFTGKACERCQSGYYGDNCTGTPETTDERLSAGGPCSRCHARARCLYGDRCECEPGFEGNGTDCTPDLCSEYNGGCDVNADCNQTGLIVNCTCRSGYQGDGSSCQPINRCVEQQNGGCSDFASCKFTGPNERQCECLPGFVGNGVQCLEKVMPPVDRCLEENGGCDPVATCKDLHYHANTAGVFHLRSPEGKYKMNFSQADAACQAEDATLATFQQLGDAQQLGMHLCVAGWMAGGRVGYPTRFPSDKCGDNHVGLVMYRDPVDQSSEYDAYCYRLREVSCSCPDGYVGDGDFCNGVLTSVLAATSNFSIFYRLLLDYGGSSSEGRQLLEILAHRKSDVTLFVPHNSGFTQNQSLSGRDLEYHTSANHSRRPFKDLKHQERIASRLGFNLTVTYGNNESCKLVDQRLLLLWDVPAVNGIIHVLEAPLTAPAPLVSHAPAPLAEALEAHNEDEDTPTRPTLFSIPNPLYSGSRAVAEPFQVSQSARFWMDWTGPHVDYMCLYGGSVPEPHRFGSQLNLYFFLTGGECSTRTSRTAKHSGLGPVKPVKPVLPSWK